MVRSDGEDVGVERSATPHLAGRGHPDSSPSAAGHREVIPHAPSRFLLTIVHQYRKVVHPQIDKAAGSLVRLAAPAGVDVCPREDRPATPEHDCPLHLVFGATTSTSNVVSA